MSDDALSRREFIRRATGAAAIVGATGTAVAQEQTETATGTAAGNGTATGTATGSPPETPGGTAQVGNGPGNATGTGDGTGTGGGTGGGDGTGTDGGGGGGGGGGTEEVIVGPGGNLTFEPADLEITPGTTVNFVWESDNHNVIPDSQPEDANWEGTPGGESETYDTGYEYSHTFETLGSYEYYCSPHLSAGMEASIEVVESLSTPGGGGPAVPDSAKTLGVATTFAMVATLTLAFFFLKYGGDGSYEEE